VPDGDTEVQNGIAETLAEITDRVNAGSISSAD